jgi:predicted RNA-binding protein with PUA-like domain
MTAYWLFKTEPEDYSFDDLVTDRRTVWDGVANNLALQYLRKIKKGDQVLIYHTGEERAVVGIAEVIRDPMKHPDRTGKKDGIIEIKPVRKLPYPVSLTDIRENKTFADFELVKISRLSVVRVKPIHWNTILGLGGL